MFLLMTSTWAFMLTFCVFSSFSCVTCNSIMFYVHAWWLLCMLFSITAFPPSPPPPPLILFSGDRGRSKKWKEMLKLPPVANTLCLRDELGKCLCCYPLLLLSLSPSISFSFLILCPPPPPPPPSVLPSSHLLPVEHTYEFLIEQQPIGKKLFLDFCATNLNLSRCMQFLTAVEELDIVVEGKKITTARQIYEDFLSLEVSYHHHCML